MLVPEVPPRLVLFLPPILHIPPMERQLERPTSIDYEVSRQTLQLVEDQKEAIRELPQPCRLAFLRERQAIGTDHIAKTSQYRRVVDFYLQGEARELSLVGTLTFPLPVHQMALRYTTQTEV